MALVPVVPATRVGPSSPLSVPADEIREFALDKLAKYKVPTKTWFLDELPKGPTGKILKRELEPPED